MEIKTNNNTIILGDVIYDKKNEYPIDCEFTLPDYCPDIERILKCELSPRLSDLNILTDSAQVEICAVVCVLYATNDGKLFGYEMPINISKSVALGMVEKQVKKHANLWGEYVNCRAINKRKIDVHGSVCLELLITQECEHEYISDVDEKSVVLKRTSKKALVSKGFCEKQISVSDDVSVSQSMGCVVNIIRQDAKVVVEECKCIAGKAIAKVCVYYEILYLNEKNKYECLKHKVPASAVIDIDGIDENCICNAKASVCTNSIKAVTNSEGEMRTFKLNSKINLYIDAFCESEVNVVCDAYCTKYESELEKQQVELSQFVTQLNETVNVNENIEIGSSLKEVIDIWCKPINYALTTQEDSLVVYGDISVCAAVCDEKDNVKYYEKIFTYKQTVHSKIDCDNFVSKLCVCPCSCNYSIMDENCIDVKIQLCVQGIITCNCTLPIVTKMNIDESRKKNFDSIPALTVYYACEGEKIWDIALKYNTSIEAIYSANSIDCEQLCKDTILLIPSI